MSKNILKIPSSTICPKCGEKYSFYMSKKRKKKVYYQENIYEGFFDSHYGNQYECYTCGYHWTVRKNEKSLLIKLFPFLENK